MDHRQIVQQLDSQARMIRELVVGVETDQARWRPTPDAWSILEVVNHLYDEEREDFRTRVDYVLHRPGEDPPPIDPQGWVTARAYNERNLAESLTDFWGERHISLAWLLALRAPAWDNLYVHPAGFRLRAGDLLTAWAAHDLLHLRQLVELHYAWHKAQSAPYELDYAGDW